MSRTRSLWGSPPSRFYRLLKRAKTRRNDSGVLSLAVLGCADGKFVVPAARLGFEVLAIDLDEIALYGGMKRSGSELVSVPGLVRRLELEGLEDRVVVECTDFTSYTPDRRYDVVLSSGAVQYSFNSKYCMNDLVSSFATYPNRQGLLYVDYMLPYEEKYKDRDNCPDASWWRSYFTHHPEWRVIYNRVLPPTLDRAHIEYPVDHYHQWGHLLAERVE